MDIEKCKKVNMLALLPCPLKVPLEVEICNFIEGLKKNNAMNIDFLIAGNANKQISYNEYIEHFESIEDIPDIVITSGVNAFYNKRFIEGFIEKGYFVDVTDYEACGNLQKLNLKDPQGSYTILTMNILVMVVDLTKLGDLPIPQSWEDLLKPEYENKVVIRGQKNNFCETTLMTIYKLYGLNGIEKLGRAVKAGWHPSQMVAAAGKNKEDAPAISVMPYFYSKTIKNKDKVVVVWPKEGAIVSPITMLVKKSKIEQFKPLVEFLTSDKIAEICNEAYFPTLKQVNNCKIPEGAVLNWIGWDFIRSKDIGNLVKELNKSFLKSHLQVYTIHKWK